MRYLKGYKTYLLVLALIVFGIAHKFVLKDVIPNDTMILIYTAFAGAIIASLRNGITTEAQKVEKRVNGGVK